MQQLFLVSAAASAVFALAVPAAGQPSRPPPAAAAPGPAAPQRTTATFADWTLRCERSAGQPVCELSQTIAADSRPVAQIAIGRTARGEPLHLTIAVPPNVIVTQPPRLGGPGKDATTLDLGWRRCLPGACYAEAILPDDTLHQLRARSDATRITFLDGLGKEEALPFSPRGLAPALDALAREDSQ